MKKKKQQDTEQQYEPWDAKEKSVMTLSINQAKLKRDTQLAEIAKLTAGLKGIDKEVDTNIAIKEMELKSARMALDDIWFDKEHKITIHRIECKIGELQDEVARGEINIKAFEAQLKQGKPKQEVREMSEEPTVDEALKEKVPEEKEPTPEEKSDVGATSDDQPKDEAETTTDEKSPNEGGEAE